MRLNHVVGLYVDATGGLVQQYKLGLAQECAGYADQLSLPEAEVAPCLCNLCIEAGAHTVGVNRNRLSLAIRVVFLCHGGHVRVQVDLS